MFAIISLRSGTAEVEVSLLLKSVELKRWKVSKADMRCDSVFRLCLMDNDGFWNVVIEFLILVTSRYIISSIYKFLDCIISPRFSSDLFHVLC